MDPPPPPPPQMLLAVVAPPPPPPPETTPAFLPPQQPQSLPPTVQPTSVVRSAPIWTPTGLLPLGTPMGFPISPSQPPLPPMFDASKPPPPLPGQVTNGTVKRRTDCEAGPSKFRKLDGRKIDESCDKCIQRELSIDVNKQEIENIYCELNYQSFVYKKKLKEYEIGKRILSALVSSQLYQILVDYVEGGEQQLHDTSAPLSTNTIMSIFKYIFESDDAVHIYGLSPSLRMDDTLPSLLTSSRLSPINKTYSILERETRPVTEPITSIQANSNVNWYNRFANGQAAESSASTSSTRDVAASTSAASRLYNPGFPPSLGPGYFPGLGSLLAAPSTSSISNMPYNPPRVGPPQATPRHPTQSGVPPNSNTMGLHSSFFSSYQ